MAKHILLFLLLLPLCSCELFEGYYVNFDSDKFVEQRTSWEESDTQNYSFVQQYSPIYSYMQPKILIERLGNEPVSISFPEISADASWHDAYNNRIDSYIYVNSISELYEFIDAKFYEKRNMAVNRDIKGFTIDITYDEETHIPTYCHINVEDMDSMIIQNETFSITSFTTLTE